MSKNTGIPYEILTKQIFQALHDQDQIENIKVQHNVKLQGKTVEHQIDVYWEYELGGVVYRAVVQTKDWDQTVSKGHLIQFKGVLDDLPGQPRGIFVTRTGYQSGAQQFAAANGIVLYELREPTTKDVEGRINSIILKITAFITTAPSVEPIVDKDWVGVERKRLNIPSTEQFQISITKRLAEMLLFKENEQKVGSFEQIIEGMYPDLKAELPETTKEHYFSEPTFMVTGIAAFPRVKLCGLRANIAIKRVYQELIFRSEDFIGFILHDVIGNKTQLIDKQHRPIKRSRHTLGA